MERSETSWPHEKSLFGIGNSETSDPQQTLLHGIGSSELQEQPESRRSFIGIAPKLFDKRWWILVAVAVVNIVSLGMRTNIVKILSLYVPETGAAPEDHRALFRKPLFFTSTYFLGQLFFLPFVGFPLDWPHHLYAKTLGLACLGAVGVFLECSALLYLPVSIAVMLRSAGLVGFTAVGSAYVTQRSSLNGKMGMALLAVVVGVVMASTRHLVDHRHDPHFHDAILGIGLIVLSTLSDASRELVGEVVLHDDEVVVSVQQYAVVWGVFGSCILFVCMVIAQLMPGGDAGSYENSLETLSMLSNSGVRLGLACAMVVACLVAMVCATFVMQEYGATTRQTVNSFRIASAWCIACLVFNFAPTTGFGEEWKTDSLAVKLVGGVFILCGTLSYVQFRREHEEEMGKVPEYERVS